MRNSYVTNWFFGIQYSLSPNWVVEGNYVGSVGHDLYAKFDVKRVTGDLLDGTLNRLNPSFGSINYAHAPFTSHYPGANFSVKKRFSHPGRSTVHGYARYSAGITWMKSID